MSKFTNSFYYCYLYLLPKNGLSSLLGKLVGMPLPRGLAKFINRRFAKAFKVNLEEAERHIDEYDNLQEFFIRRLKPGLRPISMDENILVSPCDGFMSVGNSIVDGQLMQVKGKTYALADLLKDQKLAQIFSGGYYATIYLSPRDYHRFHIPLDGDIVRTVYIPGALWPVNQWGVTNIDGLFCQNERVITVISAAKTKRLMAHIAVGATVVGKIDLEYCKITKGNHQKHHPEEILHEPIAVKKGVPLGKFMFGSTIIMLMEPGLMGGFTKQAPSHVKMGETLGNLLVEPK